MISTIYAKALRINNAVKSEMGVGAITNLQSNDASKVWGAVVFLNVLWCDCSTGCAALWRAVGL